MKTSERRGELVMHFQDGELVEAWSYETCLYTVAQGNNLEWERGVLNATKYSATTSKHQNIVRGRMSPESIEVDGMPRKAKPHHLASACEQRLASDKVAEIEAYQDYENEVMETHKRALNKKGGRHA